MERIDGAKFFVVKSVFYDTAGQIASFSERNVVPFGYTQEELIHHAKRISDEIRDAEILNVFVANCARCKREQSGLVQPGYYCESCKLKI